MRLLFFQHHSHHFGQAPRLLSAANFALRTCALLCLLVEDTSFRAAHTHLAVLPHPSIVALALGTVGFAHATGTMARAGDALLVGRALLLAPFADETDITLADP